MINICLNHLESRHPWRAPLFAALLLSLSACGGGSDSGAASTSGYTVSAIASAGGSVDQPTATVSDGASTSFTFTPDTNYSIDSVGGTCGGVLSGNTYTTDSIAADCTVEASFIANSFTVNATYGTGGSISPASVTVDRGATTSFTVTPYLGFATNIGGSCGGTLNGNIYTTDAINADCTVQASFDLNNYTISTSTSAGGGINPASAGVNHGNTASFTLTPFTGYEIAGVGGTCGGTLVGDVYTTASITASCSVVANFSLISYTVTTSAGTGGNFNPTSINNVTYGSTPSVTVNPNTGYNIDVVGGTCGGALSVNTYTTAAITGDCTIDASFIIKSYTVTPSVAGANGSIVLTPATVEHGAMTSFAVTPDLDYHAEMAGTCGGTLDLAGTTYTTAGIIADCTVVASFVSNSHTVTASVVGNGSISSPGTTTVTHGDPTSFTVTPDLNYHASMGGTCSGILSGTTYTTTAITADCTVIASFFIDTYTVTPSAGANGSISPDLATVFDYGAIPSFTVTPDVGYTASVAGTCGGALVGTTYTTAAITADCTVVASFTPPELAMTMQSVKTFAFSWANVSNATEYRLLEDPDGSSGYTQIATLSTGVTSYQLEAYLPGRINARYMLEACDAGICASSNVVSVSGNLASAAGYVKAHNSGASDDFGRSVSLSSDGKTMAVGAPLEDGADINSGAVYIFHHNGIVWSQQAYLTPPPITITIPLIGDITVLPSGVVFGSSVALSGDGNTLAVGSPKSNSDQGRVYVYRYSGTTWNWEKSLASANATAGYKFGTSLSLSANGNTLAVGEPGFDLGGVSDIGAAYLYGRSGSTWTLQGGLTSSWPYPFASSVFGSSVALSADGSILAVGSPGWNLGTGLVEVFLSGTFAQWLTATDAGSNDQFGHRVALSADGGSLAVSAPLQEDDANFPNTGAVYIFNSTSSGYLEQHKIQASNLATDDNFGYSIALSDDGNSLAVGARYEDSSAIGIGGDQYDELATDSGAVYTFTLSSGTWSQQAYVKAPNTAAYDYFGIAAALSGDGNTMAVGAGGEDSNANGINGSQTDNLAGNAGAVYLY